MPTVKVNELTGSALDWAVAKANGWVDYPDDSIEHGNTWHLDAGKAPFGPIMRKGNWKPSTDWSQGGPIIERNDIYWTDNGRRDRAGKPFKWMSTKNFSDPLNNFYGPTILIAAMRCYVASKLGDEIEIPEELR